MLKFLPLFKCLKGPLARKLVAWGGGGREGEEEGRMNAIIGLNLPLASIPVVPLRSLRPSHERPLVGRLRSCLL